MSDMSAQSNGHTLANAWMRLLKENGIIWEKINASCLETCPILHQGNSWNFPRKLIPSALHRELAHLATPSGICNKTSRAPPCSNTIILWSSARKPGFHLPCLRMTFNLLAMNCYYTGQLMTGLRCNMILPPGWWLVPKACRAAWRPA